MRIEFKNGSYIKSIDATESIKGVKKELDMSDIDWFCDFFRFKLFAFQKMFIWLRYHSAIHKMRNAIEKLRDTKDCTCE